MFQKPYLYKTIKKKKNTNQTFPEHENRVCNTQSIKKKERKKKHRLHISHEQTYHTPKIRQTYQKPIKGYKQNYFLRNPEHLTKGTITTSSANILCVPSDTALVTKNLSKYT